MIQIDQQAFKDEHGRTVMLRGVNLGGSSKMPAKPNGASHIKERFYEYKAVSFVGRPFPAPEADEHFERLRHWGFNCLRFVITWEAIEHAGPGQYDLIYLDYLKKMVAKAGEYGFYVFIDPHQDVWSRWTGGDGAPAWTLEAAGFDLTKLHAAGAAFVHQEHGDTFPTMRWVTNYNKLATATMFTLFFGGNDFAPNTTVDGVPIQEFLQSHYINAIKKVAEQVKDMPHVMGYDSLNEPSAGWIGKADLHDNSALFNGGQSPTPFQSMLLGAGIPQEVPFTELGPTGLRTLYTEIANPNGVQVWREGHVGVWLENDVWMLNAEGEPYLRRLKHFSEVNGRPVNFSNDYFRPFIERFAREIRTVHPEAIIFIEEALGTEMPPIELENVVNAGHWYDVITLFMRRYISFVGVDVQKMGPVFGQTAVENSFAAQLAHIKQTGHDKLNAPTLLGEFGIAYDLDDRVGFTTGDFSTHILAMDRTWRALEGNLLSGTLWNYTADNNNEHGDQWNGEDLSIFSRDQIHPLDDPHDLDAGGRAKSAFIRPYPRATAGQPLKLAFDIETRHFEFSFKHDPAVTAPTEIFVPSYHYHVGLAVEVSDGRCEYDEATQILTYYHTDHQDTHTIRLFREHGPAEVLTGRITLSDGESLPLEHRYLKANGLTFHVVMAGPADGEPVLLLHGFPEFWYGWKYQIPYLVRQGYRVIAPDQRGYNLSDKPPHVKDYHPDLLAADVVALLDVLGYDQVKIVGHDWGALAAWWAAAQYPERFEKVVVLNVPHPTIGAEHLQSNLRQMLRSWYIGAFQIPLLPERMMRLADWRSLKNKIHDYLGLPDTFTAEDLAQYERAWNRPHAMRSMVNWYRAIMRYRPELENPVIRPPLLMIWGAKDKALGREMVRPSIERYTAEGELVFIEEGTHWIQHDEPERVNGYIGRFFA